MGKIFGIGLPKTGTTSLAAALRKLGYKTLHYPRDWRRFVILRGEYKYNRDDWDAVCNFAEWFFPEMDECYPGSKFILTTRPLDKWLLSCEKQFPGRSGPYDEMFHPSIFGTLIFKDTLFERAYRAHIRCVTEYFQNREDLLVMTEPFSWEPLCTFLGVDMPDEPYPYVNRSI